MLRERGRLALSDFAKVAAHSALLKARVESNWHSVEIRFSQAERFIVRADEMLTAFVELEAATFPRASK